jgi:hypothetical protein
MGLKLGNITLLSPVLSSGRHFGAEVGLVGKSNFADTKALCVADNGCVNLLKEPRHISFKLCRTFDFKH